MREEEINRQLEELSEKVRMGCPIGLYESLAVIEYQEKLKQQRLHRKRIKRIRCKMNLIMVAVVVAVVAFTALTVFVCELIFTR